MLVLLKFCLFKINGIFKSFGTNFVCGMTRFLCCCLLIIFNIEDTLHKFAFKYHFSELWVSFILDSNVTRQLSLSWSSSCGGGVLGCFYFITSKFLQMTSYLDHNSNYFKDQSSLAIWFPNPFFTKAKRNLVFLFTQLFIWLWDTYFKRNFYHCKMD
jgi:hypothetical protein